MWAHIFLIFRVVELEVYAWNTSAAYKACWLSQEKKSHVQLFALQAEPTTFSVEYHAFLEQQKWPKKLELFILGYLAEIFLGNEWSNLATWERKRVGRGREEKTISDRVVASEKNLSFQEKIRTRENLFCYHELDTFPFFFF